MRRHVNIRLNSFHEVQNLFNELEKRDKMQRLVEHVIAFSQ